MIKGLLITNSAMIACRTTFQPRHAELVSASMAQPPRLGHPVAHGSTDAPWTLNQVQGDDARGVGALFSDANADAGALKTGPQKPDRWSFQQGAPR